MGPTTNQENCTSNLEGAPYVVFVTLNCVSGFLALAGNFLILFSFYKIRSLRTTSNYFICSLACADLLVGLLLNPLYIAIVTLRVWVSDHPLYQAENYIWMHSLTTTTFNLAAITLDRYVAITSVFHYHKRLSRKRCIIVIAFIWGFSAIFASVTLLVPTEDDSKLWVACVLVTVGAPLAVIGYCYCHIYRAAKRQAKNIAATCLRSASRNPKNIIKFAKNRKAAVTTGIVIGLFLFLFAPNFIFSIVEIAAVDMCDKLTIYRHWLWAIWLAFSSSACNPWVYGIRCREYRVALRIYVLRSREPKRFAARRKAVLRR